MVWAPDSTNLWAPDSGHPDLWASDSREPLTPGRAAELFLAAKAAEGASPRRIEWYRMIIVRRVRVLGPDRSVDGRRDGGPSGPFQPRSRLVTYLPGSYRPWYPVAPLKAVAVELFGRARPRTVTELDDNVSTTQPVRPTA
jgi:hypothetical protein